MTLLLNEQQIENLITVSDINDIVDKTFIDFGEDKVVNPTKVSLDLGETGNWPDYEGFMNAMPAYVNWLDVAGLKWVGGFAGKRKEANLPYITALIQLIDPKLGTFTAVMDGSYISNMRTGSQAAVALKYLGKKDSVTIGMYGAGLQARKAVMCIADLFNIERLVVWNHRRVTAEKFKTDMEEYVKGEIILADPDHPEQAADNDALFTFTPAQEPFLTRKMIKSGTIVFPMGSFVEITEDIILEADKIIVDHIDQALHRGVLKPLTKKGKISEENIYCTMGELAANKVKLTDISKEIIVCIPIGTGALDVAVAEVVRRRALDKGVGSHFDFI
ncbi:ornithine cyclodeaminase family protein [Aerococcaceae bacterium WGS1372]